MRIVISILVLTAVILAVASPPGSAGWRERDEARRARRMEKTDSKALCFILSPWPWKCVHVELDSDGDGVPDSKDRCPDTPAGAIVDKHGCPIDSDGDGVYDGLDKCPDTPRGAKVDRYGCPIDSDGDGVYDGLDKCPGTPRGAKVDEHGCPIDSDGDGVYDGLDKCPDTPAGTEVDEHGCPIEVKEFIDTGLITTTEILFATNKAELKPESKQALDKIGNLLMQVPDLTIEIGGHTDSQGAAAYNLKLSGERAKAVRDYLAKEFPDIKPARLLPKGYGEEKPIADNSTAEGRSQNRRVEFKIIK